MRNMKIILRKKTGTVSLKENNDCTARELDYYRKMSLGKTLKNL